MPSILHRSRASKKRGYTQTHACHHKPGAYPDPLLIENPGKAEPTYITRPRRSNEHLVRAMPCHAIPHIMSLVPIPSVRRIRPKTPKCSKLTRSRKEENEIENLGKDVKLVKFVEGCGKTNANEYASQSCIAVPTS